jgi:hypothetical protein
LAQLPFIHQVGGGDARRALRHRATVHCDSDARAIIPAAVCVDIGCGMMAIQTSLNARELPETSTAFAMRSAGRCRWAGPTTGEEKSWGEKMRLTAEVVRAPSRSACLFCDSAEPRWQC